MSRRPHCAPRALGVLLILLTAYPAVSRASIDDYLAISGFGTLSAVHSSYSQADFAGDIDENDGAGFGRSLSFAPDSDLGVQANLDLGHSLSGVVQVVARDDGNGHFAPELEWANLRYDVTPDFSVRAGRFLLPTNERSDTQHVGYSLPWVRVPLEITYTSTATRNDGLDLLYRLATGAVVQHFELEYGTTLEDLPGVDFSSNRARIALLSDTLQYGNISVHLAYQACDSIGFPPARERLWTGGFDYQPGSWFLTGDTGYTRDSYFGDLFAWYLSPGVHVGRFSPYALYSSTHQASLGASRLASLGNEHTLAGGVRWDFARNLDLKLQFERVTLDTVDDPAAFAKVQAGAKVGDHANVSTLALDFVF